MTRLFSRPFLLIVWAGFLVGPALGANSPKTPRHDPEGQVFRRAPMSESSRSVVVNLSSNLHLAFDTGLCRVHTVWVGSSLNLWGPPYSDAKSPFICDFEGKIVYSFPQIQPWLERSGQFKAIDLNNGFHLSYLVGKTLVSERISGGTQGRGWRLERDFSMSGERPQDLTLLVFAEPRAAARISGNSVAIESTNGVFSIQQSGEGKWDLRTEAVDYTTEWITEAGTENGNPHVSHRGEETRVYLTIPRGTDRLKVTFQDTDSEIPMGPVIRSPVKSFASAERRWPDSGDEFYRIEHFPLPPQAELLITGMDVLPNGDLILCTWLGEVFVVHGATGSPAQATYERIAWGLNEPLGIAVHGSELFVMQKGELTRLVDSNGDGEIDRFECVNDDWGYSGNYHSYSFGPVITPEDDLLVFITGQRGRADLLYQGWALRIDPKTGASSPICDGLRVPHGFGLFGTNIFVADNQGNWIGACKLNHIQTGNFYGFPSSRPSPPGPRAAEQVAPPVLWFPRSLSPSTSGFDTIRDDRFGPFKGQLMIGDFQNAVVTRAFLERIDGVWQGAVFPFAKGFLSGVNRLKMNRDGRLYVGGGKRTWSTAAPSEFALDRVSFTGRVPFDVQEVRAEPDGFTLVFTKPVEESVARDPQNYLVKQFTYEYHAEYGSPEFDQNGTPGATELPVESAAVSSHGLSVHLKIPGLKTGFVTSFQLAVNSAEDEDPRSDHFYYTLNRVGASLNTGGDAALKGSNFREHQDPDF